MITHPEKVLFPDDGITKGELAAYYEAIAPLMVPHLRGPPGDDGALPRGHRQERVLPEERLEGIPDVAGARGSAQEGRHGAPSDRPRRTRSLLWLANQNCITPHVWTSRAPDLYYPDVCVFDLDPSRDDEPDVLRAAALALRDLLERARSAELGEDLRARKGFTSSFRSTARRTWATSRASLTPSGALLVARDPKQLTQEFSKADRGGRILVDTGRNGYSATFAAAYAVRAKPGAPVSAPCTWEEVESGTVEPQTFTLRNMSDRVAKVGDLWSDMRKRKRSLRTPIERLRKLSKKAR